MSGAFGFSDVAYVGAVGSVAAFDPDAQAYITAVETADGQALEADVRTAINDFVVGCKAGGIWAAIKASCILAGARTLAGALVPLVGPAPTNFNFVSGDYNRKTGLAGNGSTKYLNSNRNNTADQVSNISCSIYVSAAPSSAVSAYIGTGNAGSSSGSEIHIGRFDTNNLFSRLRNATRTNTFVGSAFTGLVAASRNVSGSYIFRAASANSTISQAVDSNVASLNYFVFARNNAGLLDIPTDARLAFYSIGGALDLALLDARVTALVNAFAAAIP